MKSTLLSQPISFSPLYFVYCRLSCRHLILLIALFAFGAIATPQADAEETQAAPQTTKVDVGVIIGMTGPLSDVGEIMRKGMELARKEATNDLRLIFEDDHGLDPVQGVKALTKLVKVDRVPVVLQWANTTLPALAPIANASRTPMIEFWDSNRGILGHGPYVFGTGNSSELGSERLARFAVEEQGRRNIAIVSLNDAWSELVAEAFASEAVKIGAKIALHERVDGATSDFRALLLRIKSSGADAIFGPMFGESIHAILKQRRALRMELPFYSSDGFVAADVQEASEAAEGVYSAQFLVDDSSFAERYRAAHGHQKNSAGGSDIAVGYAALAYDAVMMVDSVVSELTKAGLPVTSENITEKLRTIEYRGISGLSVPTAESTKVNQITVIRNGEFERTGFEVGK